MRVCLICRSALGGGANHARYLLRALEEGGHPAGVVCQWEWGGGFPDGEVYRVPLPSTAGGFQAPSWLASGALLGMGSVVAAQRHRASIVHVMEVAASGLAGCLAARAVPAVTLLRFGGFLPAEVASNLHPRGWSPNDPPERVLSHPHPAVRLAAMLQRQYLRTYDFLLPTSRNAADLLRRMGVPGERVRVIPNGVDTRMFAPRPAPRLFPGPTLLAGGRFEPAKGFDVLLRAAAGVHREFPDFRLVLVGEGSLEGRLRALTQELGLGGCVVFRPRVSHGEMVDLFSAVDGVVVPNQWNVGVSSIHLEAMACGRPVVAAAILGVVETIKPGRSGLLYAPGDVEGLAESLRALLGDPELRERMGAEARRAALEDFSMEAMVERTLEVYREAESRVRTGPGG